MEEQQEQQEQRLEQTSEQPFDDVKWNDVSLIGENLTIESKGNACQLSNLLSKDLRRICSRLKIKGVKNAPKEKMIKILKDTYMNREKYETLRKELSGEVTGGEQPRKQPQCSFRLMNIIFCDEFAPKFASLGNVAERNVLDTGTAANDEYFWVEIQQAFIEPNESYGSLLFQDDDVLGSLDDIDPSIIVAHDWKKLRKIWKGVNADYKAAVNRYSLSGTHEADFYSFCNGKQEVYYLRKHLELKPELTGTVEADLPEEAFAESSSEYKQPASSTNSSTKRKRAGVGGEIADALREINNSKMQLELAKRKLDLMENAEKRFAKEEERKDKEEKRRESEEERRCRKELFDEWERIQSNIRLIRYDIKQETSEEVKCEMETDINALVKKKKEISDKLGL